MKKIAVIILSIFSIFPVSANDGSYTYHLGSGGAVMPVQNDAIGMVKETISIDIVMKSVFSYMLEYDCRFVFRNTTGKKQTVLVGFPNSQMYRFSGSQLKIEKAGSSFVDFKFYVNESMVEYKILESAYNPDKKEIPVYDEVYVTEVTFLPKEIKTLRNTYSMGKFITSKYNPMGGTAPRANNSIDYILMTGRTWKDPIGEADIIINWKNCPDDFLTVSGTPSGYTETNNQVTYHFKNFTPKEDIHLFFRLKKSSLPHAIAQIDSYVKKGDYETAYSLFQKLAETENAPGMKREVKDTIRTSMFFTAGKAYKTNIDISKELYLLAFPYCYSYDSYSIIDFPGNNSYELFRNNFKSWEHEGENNAPCYYIAYNLACIYSLNNNDDRARKWLQAAFEMKPSLLKSAQTDPDLANLKKANGGTIENKRQKTMNLSPSFIAKDCYVYRLNHMGMNADRNIFIIYRDTRSNTNLKYAVLKNNKWTTSVIEGKNVFGDLISVSVDKKDLISVAYVVREEKKLKYAKRVNNAWEIETIDSDGPFYQPYGIIDKNGVPYIFYYSFNEKNIRYAYKIGDEWKIGRINDKDNIGSVLGGVTVDKDNIIRVFYPCVSGNNIYLLKCATKNISGWDTHTIDNDINADNILSSFSCNITLEKNSIPHIVYSNWNKGVQGLRYGTLSPGNTWITAAINDTDIIGNGSIAVNTQGSKIICYFNYTNNVIVMSENNSDGVKSQVLDIDASIPWGGIFMDDKDRIHMVYNNLLTQDLQYAELK